ncbi:MAG: glycoside hydrolase family 38 C-terminal domain-containing protein [Eubacteriales bacterium]|nr:glycoside hydrolase family 38 C-terminal domain-containing protein [Eubacteriales bacterium]
MKKQAKRVHLISNAHIDPTWQWEWEEGAAEAVSTYRVAARFCEEFGDYVFCHNEVILYEWVREYEPSLFKKIQQLVADGRWHIMGGWYTQPDCNMPSGEGFVRQCLYGLNYFKEYFGIRPTTAVNFDSFGHSRGLVQIFAKSGYDSYIFCRPDEGFMHLESDLFRWVGYDNSSVMAYRAREGYGNNLGQAVNKIKGTLGLRENEPLCMCLWGMGNHGGGASHRDITEIEAYKKELAEQGVDIFHSTPEAFFAELKNSGRILPEHRGDLNLWAPGCYTSQIRIKQKYRELENIFFSTEKMCVSASMNGLIDYPREEFREALTDMLTAQFHDYLPGTSVEPVEQMGIRQLDHGIEIMTRVRARAFFALAGGQKIAADDEIPILVYNPHPYEIEADIECEFMLWIQNWSDKYNYPIVYDENGVICPAQPEKENSSIPIDWRKRVVFHGKLAPSSMSRFNCKFKLIPMDGTSLKPSAVVLSSTTHFIADNGITRIEINRLTGLIDKYIINGKNYLQAGAFSLDVIRDNYDPWGMTVTEFSEKIGEFTLLPEKEGSLFSGHEDHIIPSVRVIEDGDVRTVIEAVFGYETSRAVLRYKLPKNGAAIDIEVRLLWNEKQRMVKLSVPASFDNAKCLGQTAYGSESLPVTGRENVSQKFIVMHGESDAFAIFNDGVYGSSVRDGVLKVSLLRSAGYTAHPLGPDRPVMPRDRFMPYIDQGERLYNFRFTAGSVSEIITEAGRAALDFNEKPMALSFYPSGEGKVPLPAAVINGQGIEMTALKCAEKEDNAYIMRLFNPSGKDVATQINIHALQINTSVDIPARQFITYMIKDGSICECGLTED